MQTFTAFAALAAIASAQSLTGPPMGVYKTVNAQPAVTATTLSNAPYATAIHKRSADGDLLPSNGPPMGVYRTAAYQSAVTATTILGNAPTPASHKVKRDDTCVAQPSGIGYVTSPDDPSVFQKDTYLGNISTSAVTPAGYTNVFTDIVAANSADNYMGFTFMNNYDVASCAAQCSAITGCASFNIYFERDPSVDPDPSACPNPPSVTRVKCIWWGGLVSLNNANNYGQTMDSFYVVITGSNGYVNTSAAAAISSSAAAAASATSSAAGSVITAVSNVGSGYTIYYSSDSTVGSFTNAQANTSYSDCMNACDQTSGCQAFTYTGGANGVGSGTCWLKTSLGSPSPAGTGYVSGSKNAASANSVSSVVSSSSSSTSATASSAAASSSSSAAVSTSSSSSSSVVLLRPTYGDGASSSSASVAIVTISNTVVSSTLTSAVSTSTSSAASSSVPVAAGKFGGSAVSTSTSTSSSSTIAPVSSSTPTTQAITSAAPTTLATMTTSSVASTTSTAAQTSTTPFYIKIGTSGSSNTYAYVNWFAGGKITFVQGTAFATKFYIDANGKLLNKDLLGFLSGYGANVPATGGAWQKLSFNALSTANRDFAKCWLQDGYVECNTSAGFIYAGTCKNDGYLYFGAPSQMSGQCGWIGMYPVSATNTQSWW